MKYPTGIQTFSQIREDGYVYVDKTALIHQLVSRGKIYFLIRPRRFGKSLMISTYWFASGTPTYLVRLLRHSNEQINELVGKYYDASLFADYKADVEQPLPMIYQSGYLTIKGYDKRRNRYLLDFPNNEVRKGFLNLLACIGVVFSSQTRTIAEWKERTD